MTGPRVHGMLKACLASTYWRHTWDLRVQWESRTNRWAVQDSLIFTKIDRMAPQEPARLAMQKSKRMWHGILRIPSFELDVGRIRTYAPEGMWFLVTRSNHFATTPHCFHAVWGCYNTIYTRNLVEKVKIWCKEAGENLPAESGNMVFIYGQACSVWPRWHVY